MHRFDWGALSPPERAKALARPNRRCAPEVAKTVRRIFEEVETEGWKAVRRWAMALDKCEPQTLALTPDVIDAARAKLTREDLAALDLAVANVRGFHEAEKPAPLAIGMLAGVRCRRLWRPIGACGLYVPGGTAPLFSTLIMLAEPARVAGVVQRVVTTPPDAKGGAHPMMITAAAACRLEALCLIGGAQAIAALTFGARLEKAEKIFGPGNAYVAEAKRYAASLPGGPAIDVPAGPSELMVIADDSADAALIAADLLSQAEHAEDAQVILAVTSDAVVAAVQRELERQLANLPRAAIASAALAQSRAFRVADLSGAADIANSYAPEHLSLQVSDPEPLIERIGNAGTIFVGAFSAETFGDYICGPSHVLPTDGAARAWSGVNTASFMKSFVVQELGEAGAASLAAPAARLARLEGLEAHARAAEMRVGADASTLQKPHRGRRAVVNRETSETCIAVEVDLDNLGATQVKTGVGFYDHMLLQVAFHGGFSLKLSCMGDLEVDAHHMIEDCAIALGEALAKALGSRRGIARYGFVLPMDEAEAKISVDLGGRPYLVFEGIFKAPLLGAYPTEMTEHVFRSLAQSLKAAIHLSVSGTNDHHKTEACFKAFGRALRQAIRLEGDGIPSTKGAIA